MNKHPRPKAAGVLYCTYISYYWNHIINFPMKQHLSKEFLLVAGLAMILSFVFLTSEVRAQESDSTAGTPATCQHDPYPSDAASVDVPCDDPSCNVGPCTNVPEAYEDETVGIEPSTSKEIRTQERLEQKEERRSALEERVQDRIINLTSNVVARLTGAIDRFEQIINRLDSRIDKLIALEVDTVSADAKLNEAKTTLESLKIQLGNLPSVREAITGDSPREKFATIKTELKSIQNSLQQLHAQLREVVALLKEAVRSAELGRGVSDAVSNENSSSGEEETEE